MTKEQLNDILASLHKYSEYISDKTNIYALLNEYKKSTREETYKLHDEITEYVNKKNISKRIFYGLLHEIVLELQKDADCSDELYDLLTNYLDGLEKYPLL